MTKNLKLIVIIIVELVIIVFLANNIYNTSIIRDKYYNYITYNVDLSDTDYIILTDYDNHLTRVYDKNTAKVLVESASVGSDKYTSKGKFYINGRKEDYRLGVKIRGERKYCYYFTSYYSKDKRDSDGLAIHTTLYELNRTYDNRQSYHNVADKKQDKDNLFKHNWSGGCTRVSDELAQFVYDNCDKGTLYIIL